MYDESDAKNLVPETIEDNFFKSEQSHSNLNITENDEQKPTIIKPINRDAIHKICSGQVCRECIRFLFLITFTLTCRLYLIYL